MVDDAIAYPPYSEYGNHGCSSAGQISIAHPAYALYGVYLLFHGKASTSMPC